MKLGIHKKSFSAKDLLPVKSLNSFKIDPFSSPRTSTKHSVILRPICHKRQQSEQIKSTPVISVQRVLPEHPIPLVFQKNPSSLHLNQNPCFLIPKTTQKIPELKTFSIPKPKNSPKSSRIHQVSLTKLNKQMTGKMNRLIKKREEKLSDSLLDFSFGAKNNKTLNN
jgi:hypothetical protein